MARHDALTDLPNRIAVPRADGARRCSLPSATSSFAVFCLDLDQFKDGQRLARPSGRRRAAQGGRAAPARPARDERHGRRGSAATSSPSSRSAASGDRRRRRRRWPSTLRATISRALRDRRPPGRHRHQHRHRAGARRRRRRRPAPEERRPRALPRQGRRPRHLPLLRAGDGRTRAGAARCSSSICARRCVREEFELHYQPIVDVATRTGRAASRRWCAGAIRSAA